MPRITIQNREGGVMQVFSCRPEEAVLIALERTPVPSLAVGCRGGGCGVCKVRVIEGEYRTGRMSRAKVGIEEERAGHALACRLYPATDLVLEVLGGFRDKT